MIMNKTLSVSAIEQGCVIDHIEQGQAILMMNLLALNHAAHKMTIGLNLPTTQGFKDLIKIEDKLLTDQELSYIAVLSPGATMNVIENFKVTSKTQLEPVAMIKGGFKCQNRRCITHVEPIMADFEVSKHHKDYVLACYYCGHVADRKTLEVEV